MKRAILLTLAACAVALMGQHWPGDHWPGGTVQALVTDFTADGNAVGCWLMFSDGTEASAARDRCSSRGDDDLTFNDSGASGFDGTGTAPTGTLSGQDAVHLDGTDDFFSLADQAEFENADFTIGCWINPDGNFAGDTFISKGDDQNYEIRKGGGTLLSAEVTATIAPFATAISGGTWVHGVLRFDGTGSLSEADDLAVEVFNNGVLDCSGSCSTASAPTGNSADLAVGARENGAAPWDGHLMECWYMDRVLTSKEIARIFLCGFDGTADGSARDGAYGGATCDAISTCC